MKRAGWVLLLVAPAAAAWWLRRAPGGFDGLSVIVSLYVLAVALNTVAFVAHRNERWLPVTVLACNAALMLAPPF